MKSRDGKSKRREEKKKEDQKRESLRRKKIQVRKKAGKSQNTVLFQWFVAPEGRKVGSLKRRMRSHVVRWEMKSCTLLWQMHKANQVRSTFRSWDVEKVHAVVARSTFRSQNHSTPRLHTLRSTLHFTLHTLHSTLHTPHSTLYTLHLTLRTLHSILYTPDSTLHTPHLARHLLPYSTVYGNRGKVHKTVQANCFREVFCVTAYPCVSTTVYH